jgi:hypothetical protein
MNVPAPPGRIVGRSFHLPQGARTRLGGASIHPETWLPMVFDRLEELSRALRRPPWFGRRMDRGQKLRNHLVIAGYPQAMASNQIVLAVEVTLLVM